MAVFECKHINKQYKDFALKDISFQIESGYLTGLIGVNGAGKSTLMNILASSDLRYTGEVVLDGKKVKDDLVYAKNHITIVSDQVEFFLDKTPLDNALLLGKYYQDWSIETFYEWLDKFEISKDKMLYQYSKGMKMKFQIAFALAHKVKFLLLDEPTAGFDPVFRKDFLKVLRDLLENDIGILMSTHITSDLDSIADYLVMIDKGQLTLNGTKEDIEDESRKYIQSAASTKGFHVGDLLNQNKYRSQREGR